MGCGSHNAVAQALNNQGNSKQKARVNDLTRDKSGIMNDISLTREKSEEEVINFTADSNGTTDKNLSQYSLIED